MFADETGDDRFDAAGSRYFGIAAVVTTDPVTTATAAHELLYELQAEGVSRRTDRDDPITSLHATYDPPHVRERVLAMIDGLAGSYRVHLSYMALLARRVTWRCAGLPPGCRWSRILLSQEADRGGGGRWLMRSS